MIALAPRGLRRASVSLSILLAAALALASAVVLAGAAPHDSVARPDAKVDGSIVVFVRHAEKDANGDAQDPGLGEAGRKRAVALARLLGHAGVTHLYASEYRRAQETLAALAERTGHKVEIVRASDAARLVDALSSAPSGSVSVVAGHSNTIPALIEALGGHVGDVVAAAHGPELRESEYDRAFVVALGAAEKVDGRLVRKATSTLEMRYGD
jgi:phosphohistidine phosphatase SixA